MKKVILVALLACFTFSVFLIGNTSKSGGIVESANEDPWEQVENLNYLFWTADEKIENDVKKLQLDLSLTGKQMEKLKELGLQEGYLFSEGRRCKDDAAKDDAVTFNQRVDETFANIDKEVRVLLGEKYNDFCKWIKTWWENEKMYRLNWLAEKEKKSKEEIGITSTDDRELVYATQYNGYTNLEIALPDKYVKFANLGWWDDIPDSIEPYYSNPPYTANVYYETTNKSVLNVLVREVGPYNEDDNYWDSATASNPRRMFTDLALGEPEAEAAKLRGYNDGKDQFGRVVNQPAGVDLTEEVAAQLRLAPQQNDWVWVRYSDLP
ncbi:MAG: hypothetical protein AUJ99_05610 [Caldisericum sp. CG2_30_36_11]|nr:MAG: hypothetical protein AUJ99_05610 [Caldisericum sp. CG2_30_36_11]